MSSLLQPIQIKQYLFRAMPMETHTLAQRYTSFRLHSIYFVQCQWKPTPWHNCTHHSDYTVFISCNANGNPHPGTTVHIIQITLYLFRAMPMETHTLAQLYTSFHGLDVLPGASKLIRKWLLLYPTTAGTTTL